MAKKVKAPAAEGETKREHKTTPEMAAAKRVVRAKQELTKWMKRAEAARQSLFAAETAIERLKAEFEAARLDLVSLPSMEG